MPSREKKRNPWTDAQVCAEMVLICSSMLRMLLVIKSRLLLKRRPLHARFKILVYSPVNSFPLSMAVEIPICSYCITRTAGPCLEVHKTTVATATVATVSTASARAQGALPFLAPPEGEGTPRAVPDLIGTEDTVSASPTG